jgi:hypothetical protein
MENNEYRRRLIARVEALRAEVGMPMLRFRQQIGPVAARDWARFVAASDEAWNYFRLRPSIRSRISSESVPNCSPSSLERIFNEQDTDISPIR